VWRRRRSTRASRGFKVFIARACATVDERLERVALDYLEAVAGVRIVRS
jgi:hypothetical protein